MPTLFATSPGRVAVLPEDIPTGLIMAISGRNANLATAGRGSFFNLRSIITDVQIEQQDDYQVQQSMNVSRYAYIFGRGVGNARISGISFSDSCFQNRTMEVVEGPFGRMLSSVTDNRSGLERICTFFDDSRIASSGQLYDMVLGTSRASRFKILMYALRVGLSKPEDRISEFAISCRIFH